LTKGEDIGKTRNSKRSDAGQGHEKEGKSQEIIAVLWVRRGKAGARRKKLWKKKSIPQKK